MVRVPVRLSNEQIEALFDSVATAVHEWEPAERDGWDADVSATLEDDSLEAGYDRLAQTLEIKQRFEYALIDGIGMLNGEHLDEFAERIVRELQSWRCGARWHSLPRVESVPDATATAAALARESWDDEADHGELMRSAAGKLAAINEAASLLLAEHDVLRWLHAEAVHEKEQLADRLRSEEIWREDIMREMSDLDLDRPLAKTARRYRLERDEAVHRAEMAEAERDAERSSRQAWAAEAVRLDLIGRERKRLLAEALNQPRHYAWGELIDEANRLAERWLDEVAAEALREPIPEFRRVCACISDDQASQLGPRFSRPVCAVHPPGWPTSTLTGMPCTHGPDSRCVECVEEGGVRVAPRGWQPGDPVHRDEREGSGEGACSDPACGVTWTPAGPTDCPRCGSPAVPAPAGTPWAEGRHPKPAATEDDGAVVEDDAAVGPEGGEPE
jgi:hypothetical protein